MTSDQQARLLALATKLARQAHSRHWSSFRPKVAFEVCDHEDCRLVREVSLEPSRDGSIFRQDGEATILRVAHSSAAPPADEGCEP